MKMFTNLLVAVLLIAVIPGCRESSSSATNVGCDHSDCKDKDWGLAGGSEVRRTVDHLKPLKNANEGKSK